MAGRARRCRLRAGPCPQPVNLDQKTSNGGGVSGVQSEDCLYLNVYAPATATKAPVVVWLYGGASFLGAGHLGSYNGTNNAKSGVITIPINYRLGPLGTFAHPSLHPPKAAIPAPSRSWMRWRRSNG